MKNLSVVIFGNYSKKICRKPDLFYKKNSANEKIKKALGKAIGKKRYETF